MKQKKNFLLESTKNILAEEQKKTFLLDIGCGDGDYSQMASDLGFRTVAADIDEKRFRYKNKIEFRHCDVTKEMPFPDKYCDYVLFMEIVEHLRNPYTVMAEVNRILKDEGTLILSTPNILNLKSRFRFIFEGAYEYFREPPLDQAKNPKEIIFNLHLVPYRYHELEYLLSVAGFKVENIFTSVYEGFGYSVVSPLIMFQAWQKERRSLKKGGIDYRRINKILFSKELLFGRHLIIKAKKIKQ
ncbi:MAG: class I SAM-dependent methyltransferase [Candidatus Omnitrophica bacterium]|jgi:SAM-dependent methyltransferase|nr:class I SAM-dependent methyltransferase [Candidatus Omnitrophota bacterium]